MHPEDNPNLPHREDNPDSTNAEEVLTWSIQKYKKLEPFSYQTAEGDRRPTNPKLSHAREMAKKFRYFSPGEVVVLDKEHKQQIVAIIEFTWLDELQKNLTTWAPSPSFFTGASILSTQFCWILAVGGRGEDVGGGVEEVHGRLQDS
jgi:hypothetical protein